MECYGYYKDYIIVMETTHETPVLTPMLLSKTRLYKGNYLKVKSIVQKSVLCDVNMDISCVMSSTDEIVDDTQMMTSNNIRYKIGEIVSVDDFKLFKINNSNNTIVSPILSRGIPYFLNINSAFHYNGCVPDNFSGRVVNYNDLGYLKACSNIKKGKLVGQWNFYDLGGKIMMFGNFVNDKEHGMWFGFKNNVISWFRYFNKGKIMYEYNYSDNICGICQEQYSMSDIVTHLSCNHTYHHKCYSKWNKRNNSCPLCRKTVTSYCPDCYE